MSSSSNSDEEYEQFLKRAYGSIDSNTREEPISFNDIIGDQTKLQKIIRTLAYYSTESNQYPRRTELPENAEERGEFFDSEEAEELRTQTGIRNKIAEFNGLRKQGFKRKTIEGLEIDYEIGGNEKKYTPVVEYLTYRDEGVKINPTFSVEDGKLTRDGFLVTPTSGQPYKVNFNADNENDVLSGIDEDTLKNLDIPYEENIGDSIRENKVTDEDSESGSISDGIIKALQRNPQDFIFFEVMKAAFGRKELTDTSGLLSLGAYLLVDPANIVMASRNLFMGLWMLNAAAKYRSRPLPREQSPLRHIKDLTPDERRRLSPSSITTQTEKTKEILFLFSEGTRKLRRINRLPTTTTPTTTTPPSAAGLSTRETDTSSDNEEEEGYRTPPEQAAGGGPGILEDAVDDIFGS